MSKKEIYKCDGPGCPSRAEDIYDATGWISIDTTVGNSIVFNYHLGRSQHGGGMTVYHTGKEFHFCCSCCLINFIKDGGKK